MTGLHSGPTQGFMSNREAWQHILPPQFENFFHIPLPSGEHTHLLDRIQGVFSKPDLIRSLTEYREEMALFVQRESEEWYDRRHNDVREVDFEIVEDKIFDEDEDIASTPPGGD